MGETYKCRDDVFLHAEKISKIYPGTKALDEVSFDLLRGKVNVLIGENGAGKSTLMKMIAGIEQPNEGKMYIGDKEVFFKNTTEARKHGIGIIHQELSLFPNLNVYQNIYMNKEKTKGKVVLDNKVHMDGASKVLERLEHPLDLNAKVGELRVGQQQMIEIARNLVEDDLKVLIMDEPTAPLTDNEVEILFELVRKLKEKGVSIIYISHRLDEIFELSDRVTVMRDGQMIKTAEIQDITKNQLIFDMVGRELTETYPKRNPKYGDKLLEVKGVCGPSNQETSFCVREGEIVGLAGLVGAGRTEMARLIIGADKKYSGEVYVKGKKAVINSPKDAIENGIAYVSEDRKNQGVLLKMSIRWNITLPILRKLSKFIFISQKEENACVNKYKDALRIKTPSVNQLVGNLSGGNQQKVAVAKWLASESKILILDEPTRGIDVGAKQEIYELINQLTQEGLGIIMISSEMEEIMGMSDRMLVMAEGNVVGELQKEEFSQDKILRYASNITT